MTYTQKCHGRNPKSVAEQALPCLCHCEGGWINPDVLWGLENQEHTSGEKEYR